MTRPSPNWLALQKNLARHGHSRKRLKVDDMSSLAASSFHLDPSLPPNEHDMAGEEIDLETTEKKNGESIATLRKMVLGKVEYNPSQTTPGKYLALDCEMVGVGIEGNESSLARVSIVNYAGAIILDVFVRQREKVVDYRTQWSGVRSTDLVGSARPFKEVQQTVADLIKDRILVGHAIYNDLKALLLSHPSPQIRDTQSLTYKHRVAKSRHPALRVLVKQEFGVVIQSGEHSSVTDARATMALFRLYKKRWESGFRPIHALSKTRADIHPASTTNAFTGLPKRKRPDSLELDGDGAGEASNPASSARRRSPSPLRTPSTQHIPPRSNQEHRKRPPSNAMERKGVSLGITTVTTKAGSIKDIRRKGVRSVIGRVTIVENSSKGGKKGDKSGEKWWKSLGGGKKGDIKSSVFK